MRFNLLLADAGLSPEDVTIILHSTGLQPLRSLLASMVAERPELFDAYQSVHSPAAEATLRNRPLMGSFVPLPDRRMVFAGLWRIAETVELPTAEIYADPRYTELERSYGAVDTAPAANIARAQTQARFRLEPMEELDGYRGRIVIAPPTGRTYARIASNLRLRILALTEESQLVPPVPDWRNLVVGAGQMRALPRSWAARLAEWRGIYLIVDQSDGARYVGSACGAANLLGRWQAHVAREQGITAELARRQSADFRFSILERVNPDMTAEEIVAIENGLKLRLDTLEHGLNRN